MTTMIMTIITPHPNSLVSVTDFPSYHLFLRPSSFDCAHVKIRQRCPSLCFFCDTYAEERDNAAHALVTIEPVEFDLSSLTFRLPSSLSRLSRQPTTDSFLSLGPLPSSLSPSLSAKAQILSPPIRSPYSLLCCYSSFSSAFVPPNGWERSKIRLL